MDGGHRHDRPRRGTPADRRAEPAGPARGVPDATPRRDPNAARLEPPVSGERASLGGSRLVRRPRKPGGRDGGTSILESENGTPTDGARSLRERPASQLHRHAARPTGGPTRSAVRVLILAADKSANAAVTGTLGAAEDHRQAAESGRTDQESQEGSGHHRNSSASVSRRGNHVQSGPTGTVDARPRWARFGRSIAVLTGA